MPRMPVDDAVREGDGVDELLHLVLHVLPVIVHVDDTAPVHDDFAPDLRVELVPCAFAFGIQAGVQVHIGTGARAEHDVGFDAVACMPEVHRGVDVIAEVKLLTDHGVAHDANVHHATLRIHMPEFEIDAVVRRIRQYPVGEAGEECHPLVLADIFLAVAPLVVGELDMERVIIAGHDARYVDDVVVGHVEDVRHALADKRPVVLVHEAVFVLLHQDFESGVIDDVPVAHKRRQVVLHGLVD